MPFSEVGKKYFCNFQKSAGFSSFLATTFFLGNPEVRTTEEPEATTESGLPDEERGPERRTKPDRDERQRGSGRPPGGRRSRTCRPVDHSTR